MSRILDIANGFQLNGTAVSAENYGGGHINDTFRIRTDAGESYILQRINTSVFKNAEALMDNVILVTNFIKEKISKEGGEPERGTLSVVMTR